MSQVPGWKVEFAPGVSDLEKSVIGDHLLKKVQDSRVIKKGKHRIVERIMWKGVDLHAKTNYLHNLRARLRRFLRPSKSQLEYSVLRDLGNIGVKSLEPVAWAETPQLFGESVLYTRTLGDSETLEDFWKKSWRTLEPKAKREICNNFATLLAQLHSGGLFHPDPHPGNILVMGHSWELRIIDLHNPIRKKNPTMEDRKKDISGWTQWGSLRLETCDLARILRHYLRVSGLGKFKHWWISISNLAFVRQKQFWAKQEPLCLKSSHRRFTRIRGNEKTGIALAEFSSLVGNVAGFFSTKGEPNPTLKVLKSSPSSQVYQALWMGKGIIIKVIPIKKGLKGFLSRLTGSDSGKRQWYWSNVLRLRLLPTPRILGWYFDSVSRCSYVIAEEIQGGHQLDQWLEGTGNNPDPKRVMIRRLAKSIRILHQRGIFNRDMKAANIMVDGLNEIQWVDLGGMGHLMENGNARRLKDLARLAGSFWESPHITNTDRLRFLKTYLGPYWVTSEGWKNHWKIMEKRASERIRARVKAGRALG